jgi:mevalonate kinase
MGKKSAMGKITNQPHEKNIHESPRKLMQQKQWIVNIKIDVKFKFGLGSSCSISLIESFYSLKIYARIEL